MIACNLKIKSLVENWTNSSKEHGKFHKSFKKA